MTINETIISIVINNHHAIMMTHLITMLGRAGIEMNKRRLLVHLRKTYRLKKEKYSDLIEYVKHPKLPERYQDKIDGFSEPDCIEDLFLIFMVKSKYIPSQHEFKEYCNAYNFHFDWSNRNNYQSLKKKWLHRLADCNIFPHINER